MVEAVAVAAATVDQSTSKAEQTEQKKTKDVKKQRQPKVKGGKGTRGSDYKTTGMALLESMTAKKAAKEALMKTAKEAVHVSFNEDGEVVMTPAVTEADSKKRKQESDQGEPKEKKQKKEKKKKGTEHLQGPSDKTRQDCLAYMKLFVDDRSQWKFNKRYQSWILQHIYDTEAIPTEDFDRLLLYLKDVAGAAREKTLKEAQTICQETKGANQQNTFVASTDTYTGYDDNDDFDAEKLLAAAPAATASVAPAQSVTEEHANAITSSDSTKLERAKCVVRTLM